jgi:hypothetical protein
MFSRLNDNNTFTTLLEIKQSYHLYLLQLVLDNNVDVIEKGNGKELICWCLLGHHDITSGLGLQPGQKYIWEDVFAPHSEQELRAIQIIRDTRKGVGRQSVTDTFFAHWNTVFKAFGSNFFYKAR